MTTDGSPYFASEAKVRQHTHIPMAPGYFADTNGIIWSASGWRGHAYRQLVTNPDDHGYPSVRVMIAGKRKHIAVHRLMASAFLPPKPSLQHEVRHIDGIKTNSSCVNLAWGTRKDNADDREKHGRTSRGITHSAAIRASGQAAGVRMFLERSKGGSAL